MLAPLSEVPKEGSSVFSLFSLIKLHLTSLPLASSYSHVAVSSVFCAKNIYFLAQTRGAPLRVPYTLADFYLELHVFEAVPVRRKDEILDVRAGFIVFPGLPLALLFHARALIGRTDGA